MRRILHTTAGLARRNPCAPLSQALPRTSEKWCVFALAATVLLAMNDTISVSFKLLGNPRRLSLYVSLSLALGTLDTDYSGVLLLSQVKSGGHIMNPGASSTSGVQISPKSRTSSGNIFSWQNVHGSPHSAIGRKRASCSSAHSRMALPWNM